jgi:hypothetical protein
MSLNALTTIVAALAILSPLLGYTITPGGQPGLHGNEFPGYVMSRQPASANAVAETLCKSNFSGSYGGITPYTTIALWNTLNCAESDFCQDEVINKCRIVRRKAKDIIFLLRYANTLINYE